MFTRSLALCLLAMVAHAAPPNVVIFLADDLGYSDLGCYGSEIQTPHLDALAADGLRFTQFYNTARCWPTRAALMTGYYAQQVGRDSVAGIRRGKGRPNWAPLVSKRLQAAGYRNYHSGKWHIDGKVLANGFHRSYHLKDQHRFFNPTIHYEDDKKLPPVPKESGYYGTIAVADKAIAYLKDHHANHATKPFFGYFAFAAPHFPLHALPKDIAKCRDRYAAGWDVVHRQRFERLKALGLAKGQLPPFERSVGPPYHFPDALKKLGLNEVNKPLPWNQLSPGQQKFQQEKMAIHAAMIERMDAEIGRIIAQIKAMKAFDDTLIVFLSDNGASAEIMVRGDGHDPAAPMGSWRSHLCLGPGWSTVANTPFRMHKTWVHEGGSHTPFIAHWPNGIKARNALRHQPAHVIDLAPTLLDLAGLPATAVAGGPPFPGTSLGPTFAADTVTDRDLWWAHEGHRAYRSGDWKLVALKDKPWELYNLANDPNETTNLATQHPEKVTTLETRWQAQVTHFRKHLPNSKK